MSPLRNHGPIIASEEELDAFNRERDAVAAKILSFADKLLTDPRAHSAFARVGLEEEFTEEEAKHIDEEMGLGHLFDTPSSVASGDYRKIVRALARRVSFGMYPDVYSAAAVDFVKRNVFPEKSYLTFPHLLPESMNPMRNPIAFEDLARMVRELAKWQDYDKHMTAFREQEIDLPEDPHYEDNLRPIYDQEFAIQQRHGLVGYFSTSSIVSFLRHEGKDIDNDDHLREIAIGLLGAERVRSN